MTGNDGELECAGVDASVVLKVVLAVSESKEKREKKKSEKFCVCDVMVGGSCCVRRSPMQCQWCQWCQWCFMLTLKAFFIATTSRWLCFFFFDS
jgi:hypothetical protein